MPATAERAAFVKEEFRSVAYHNEGVRTLYGKVARDTKDDPVETYFDEETDAFLMVQERGAILGAHARLFRVTIDAVIGEADLDMALSLPSARLIDDELVADMDVAVAAIESVDFETERTVLRVWGIAGAAIVDPVPDVPPGTESFGTAAAVGAASGASSALAGSAGASAAVGVAAGVGVRIQPAAGSTSATGAASATGADGGGGAVGATSGVATASATGVSVKPAAGSASATGAASAIAADPHFASTVLLCGCEGTHAAAADLDDESFANHANGVAGGSGTPDATYSTTQKMFGQSSLYLDTGKNDFVRFADHGDWTLGAGDFTIEMFVYFNGSAQLEEPGTLISHWLSTGNQRGWQFKYEGVGTNMLRFFGSSNGSTTTTFLDYNWTPTVGQWYYVCVERSGNTFRMYVGVPGGTATMVATASNSISFFDSTSQLQISGVTSNETDCLKDVYLDEIRMTSLARYATDAGFPVPSAAFPRS